MHAVLSLAEERSTIAVFAPRSFLMPCLFALAVSLLCTPRAGAADWPEWRGPARNSVVSDGPSLAENWPRRGPKLVWRSEHIPGDDDGGFASVAVADGRAYVYCNWKYKVSTPTRTLTGDALRQLGWYDDMPEDLRVATEKARLSAERASLETNEIRGWAGKWVADNIPEEHRRWRGPCQRRLMLGEEAVPVDVLLQLKEIADDEFSTQDAIDGWFAEHDIGGTLRERVMKVIPDTKDAADDVFFCLDADTGETIWKQRYPGAAYDWACSSTPCVVDGMCLVLGSDANAYCFDAETGDLIWKTGTKARTWGQSSASFVVVDGVAVLSSGPLAGYEAATGELLWRHDELEGHHNSPVYWENGGRTLLVCQLPQQVACVDPADGTVLWTLPSGSSQATATVQGDRMVVATNDEEWGLRCFRLSEKAPELLWTAAVKDRGVSPLVYNGYVYTTANSEGRKLVCLDVETGALQWEHRIRHAGFASPVGVDGKVLLPCQGALLMATADPHACTVLGEAPLNLIRCTTPTVVDGRVFLRTEREVVCYDLTAAGPVTAASRE